MTSAGVVNILAIPTASPLHLCRESGPMPRNTIIKMLALALSRRWPAMFYLRSASPALGAVAIFCRPPAYIFCFDKPALK